MILRNVENRIDFLKNKVSAGVIIVNFLLSLKPVFKTKCHQCAFKTLLREIVAHEGRMSILLSLYARGKKTLGVFSRRVLLTVHLKKNQFFLSINDMIPC